MERRALVLALALTLPLALYGIPYAYASATSSSYLVLNIGNGAVYVHCNTGDYATGGGALAVDSANWIGESYPVFWTGSNYVGISTGQPNAWTASAHNPASDFVNVFVICQTPIVVAGIGVPEFGSLYVAIALGAVLYFLMARRFAGRPTIPAPSP
jgi:hypothetical protein